MARSRLVMKTGLSGRTPASRFRAGSRAHHPMSIAGGQPLLLPYRYVPLDALDAVPACLERLRPVRRGTAHHDRRLAHLQAAGAVENGDLQDRPPLEDLLADGFEADPSLLVPRLVVEAGHLAALRAVPDGPGEQHGSPRRWVGHEPERLRGVQKGVGEANEERWAHARILAGASPGSIRRDEPRMAPVMSPSPDDFSDASSGDPLKDVPLFRE